MKLNIDHLNIFLGGAIMVACWIVALFFLKFYSRTKDSFFGFFALAFFILGSERILLAYARTTQEVTSPMIYLMRLAAFLLIIWAIFQKNLAAKR